MTHDISNPIDNLINEKIAVIRKLGDIHLDKAIYYHYSEVMRLYKKNKLFYKSIFKSHRFNLACLLIAEYYTKENAKLLDITNHYLPLKILSKNSIAAFYNSLIVTGRIKVWRSQVDGRHVRFSITDKLKDEACELILSMLKPVRKYFNNESINEDIMENLTEIYFKNFSAIIYLNHLSFDQIESAKIFIDKDAGHTIIINLFCHKKPITKDTYKTLSVKDLSYACGVSRSHIKKILNTAEAAGFIHNPSKESEIIITRKFLEFTREYMSLHLSFALISLNL